MMNLPDSTRQFTTSAVAADFGTTHPKINRKHHCPRSVRYKEKGKPNNKEETP